MNGLGTTKSCLTHYCLTGPFVPVWLKYCLKKGIIKKISYDHHVYESVDWKSLS